MNAINLPQRVQCDLCGRSYARQTGLNRHLRKSHKTCLEKQPPGPQRKYHRDVDDAKERRQKLNHDGYMRKARDISGKQAARYLIVKVKEKLDEVAHLPDAADKVKEELQTAIEQLVEQFDVPAEREREQRQCYLWMLGLKVLRVEDANVESLEPAWPYERPSFTDAQGGELGRNAIRTQQDYAISYGNAIAEQMNGCSKSSRLWRSCLAVRRLAYTYSILHVASPPSFITAETFAHCKAHMSLAIATAEATGEQPVTDEASERAMQESEMTEAMTMADNDIRQDA
ncbi:hypothetical protein SYNPS1DRAFT_30365 [Syncephalis pseudoplumigaleata]|uniref:C2H2-type domain-containing protein n=1 Tax=Syncephalis pseudoplumigaleata TaxID=1712513 RepID=A0A4P9YV04_9FUNG|nr:hypothetical protein SYNPS1DRAFT_30365 [Syncephalis pseudoplumigaleata]|eukprot:RKP23873.1 hypothetical protein SYNPS1DRAFT_30365 [Syncephalis pseudoplumigaleata]